MYCPLYLKYWNLDDYLGLGVAAHSCLDKVRYENQPSLIAYLSDIEKNGSARIGSVPVEEPFEQLMLQTRLLSGVPLSVFSKQNDLLPYAEELAAHGLVTLLPDRIILTARGMDVQNEMVLSMARFL